MSKPRPARDDRTSILAAITPQTRVIALVALISEALFLAAAYSIPVQHRLVAYIVAAVILIAAIAACVRLELARDRSPEAPSYAELRLPQELKGNVFVIDPATQTDVGAGADLYRTASNFKFAGKYTDAIELYRKVLDVQPHHWKARYNIGSCLMYLGRLQEAELHFKRLVDDLKEVAIGSNSLLREILHGCFIQLNDICDRRGDFDAGSVYLRESLVVKPDDALSYLNLTISAIRAGKREEAIRWYQVVLQHPQQLQVLSSVTPEDRAQIESIAAIEEEVAHDKK